MKQFVYEGDYTHYRGYVFAYGKPTTVSDNATITELLKHPHFKEFDHEEKAPETTPPEVLIPACPKCGKKISRSGPMKMHTRFCKG